MDTIVAYLNQTKLFSVRNAPAELQHHETVDSGARAHHSQRRVPDRTKRARSRINALFHAPRAVRFAQTGSDVRGDRSGWVCGRRASRQRTGGFFAWKRTFLMLHVDLNEPLHACRWCTWSSWAGSRDSHTFRYKTRPNARPMHFHR